MIDVNEALDKFKESVDRLYANFMEFDTITDQEFLNDVDKSWENFIEALENA
jgi:hypothetical protein